MDLFGLLWIAVGIGAIVFAVDAFASVALRRRHAAASQTRVTWFGAAMLLFAVACIILGLHETLS